MKLKIFSYNGVIHCYSMSEEICPFMGLVEEHQEFAMWKMGKWDNKAGIDRAEEMGLIWGGGEGRMVLMYQVVVGQNQLKRNRKWSTM